MFHIQSRFKPASDFDHGNTPGFIELADVEHHRTEFAQEKVPWLALDVEVLAWRSFRAFAFHPEPEALSPMSVEKNQQVFMMLLGDQFGESRPDFRVWDAAVLSGDFEHNHPSQFRDLSALELHAVINQGCGFPDRWLRPAQYLDEESSELEFLQQGSCSWNCKLGHIGQSTFYLGPWNI